MKNIILFFFLFSSFVYTQETQLFDKVIFKYHFSFDRLKDSVLEEETVEFTKFQNTKYILNLYNRNLLNSNNIEKFKKTPNKLISSFVLDSLFYLIKNNEDNFNDSFLKPKLKKPKKKLIKEILKHRNFVWSFDSLKKQIKLTKEMTKRIQRFENFNEFIDNIKPQKNTLYGRLDSYYNLSISLIKNKDTIIYNGISNLNCGLPLCLEKDIIKENKIIDLQINRLLLKILPKKSLIRREFDYNNMVDLYIDWFFENENNK